MVFMKVGRIKVVFTSVGRMEVFTKVGRTEVMFTNVGRMEVMFTKVGRMEVVLTKVGRMETTPVPVPKDVAVVELDIGYNGSLVVVATEVEEFHPYGAEVAFKGDPADEAPVPYTVTYSVILITEHALVLSGDNVVESDIEAAVTSGGGGP